MADCRRPQLTWVDHAGLWLLPVLNLPGMVKGVPGSPAGHEQGRAARAGQVGAVSRGGAGFDLGQDSGAQARDGGNVAGQKGPLLDPEHPGMENLGLADMLDDRVAIPATTARALAKHPRRGSRSTAPGNGAFGQHVRAREPGSSRRSHFVIRWLARRSGRGGRRGGAPAPDFYVGAASSRRDTRTNCRHLGARGSP
jgi:hypothetical protein